jgi:hypothetical protein
MNIITYLFGLLLQRRVVLSCVIYSARFLYICEENIIPFIPEMQKIVTTLLNLYHYHTVIIPYSQLNLYQSCRVLPLRERNDNSGRDCTLQRLS